MQGPRDAFENRPANVVHEDVMINPSASGRWGKLPILLAAVLLLVIVGAFVMAASRITDVSSNSPRAESLFLKMAALIATPATAQDTLSESDCNERFKAADRNQDHVLTPTEIPKAQHLPPSLAKEVLISRKEYVAACMKLSTVQTPGEDRSHVVPETKGHQQPQGPTGPITTKSGGAPAESPQGQTPPGMQSAPQGSGKPVIEPPK